MPKTLVLIADKSIPELNTPEAQKKLLKEANLIPKVMKWLDKIQMIETINARCSCGSIKPMAEKDIEDMEDETFIAAAIAKGFKSAIRYRRRCFNMSEISINALNYYDQTEIKGMRLKHKKRS